MINANQKHNSKNNIAIQLTPLSGGDFIIAIKNINGKTTTVFVNDQQVAEVKEIGFDQYHYGIEDGVLKKIFIVKKDLRGLGSKKDEENEEVEDDDVDNDNGDDDADDDNVNEVEDEYEQEEENT